MKNTHSPLKDKASRFESELLDPFSPDPQRQTCKIEGCDKEHYARGWCQMHYRRWQRHGHPLATVEAAQEPVVKVGK